MTGHEPPNDGPATLAHFFGAGVARAMVHGAQPVDPELHAALARAGGFMIGRAPSGKLHAFDEGRTFSRCGTVSRSMAIASSHQMDLAAIEAGESLCRTCFPHADEQRAALRLQAAS